MSPEILALCALALLAGFINSIVGGGGLIQMPGLLICYPTLPVATLMGTEKLSSFPGTVLAAWRYSRQVQMPWRTLLPMALPAFVAALCGAVSMAHLPGSLTRPLILGSLVLVLAYSLWRKDFGKLHAPKLSGTQLWLVGAFAGGALGFYDGFIGPGAASFMVLAFVAIFGFDFLHASAASKALNTITNGTATVYFVSHGHVLPGPALAMAIFNSLGTMIGTQVAMRRGSGFVRVMFIGVVSLLILRLGWDLWTH